MRRDKDDEGQRAEKRREERNMKEIREKREIKRQDLTKGDETRKTNELLIRETQ